ncbi:hypothetical protein Tco_1564541, partial [Tanacetum coccineum]
MCMCKDSPLEIVAFTDSDYAGATLDRKSTTGGCQCLGNRLISWQCKKQTVVATSTTEAEYVAAASCCGQVFSNMRRITKGFSGHEVDLFPTMLDAAESSPSPSKITSSPSPTPSSSPTPEPSPTQPSPPHPSPSQHSPPQPGTEYPPPTPHDSPLHAVHSHGREEGSLKLQELMGLITTLSDRIGILEADLSKTKKIYSSAYTKLILRVKKLESQIKVGKARRHSRFVLSDTEVGKDDSSKQGRKFSNEGAQDDEEIHDKTST